MAAGWHARVVERLPPAPAAVAGVAGSHPETFALLFALSALPATVVLLHPEPSTWRSEPPFPTVMPIFLTPATAGFAPALEKAGLFAIGLPRGARVSACLPLATSFGLGQNFLLPAYLGGHVGLLERFDHRSLLNLFAQGEYDY